MQTHDISVQIDGWTVFVELRREGALPHRRPLLPGVFDPGGLWVPTDLSGEDEAVRTACATAWTADAVAAFQRTIPWEPPVPPTAEQVKAEAARRISLIMPDHAQRNVLALAQEMMLSYGIDPAKWPYEHRQTLADVLSKWAAIKAIRQRSNEIEVMQPIPDDFADDGYWPAA